MVAQRLRLQSRLQLRLQSRLQLRLQSRLQPRLQSRLLAGVQLQLQHPALAAADVAAVAEAAADAAVVTATLERFGEVSLLESEADSFSAVALALAATRLEVFEQKLSG